jgi:hypothetical protein
VAAAEQRRLQDEQAELEWKKMHAQQEEQQRQYLEAKRQEAIEAAEPVNKLRQAYYNYFIVQACYKQRNGYLVTFVSDVEMDRSRRAAKDLEKLYLSQDSSIDKNAVWNSVRDPSGYIDFDDGITFCQVRVRDLMNAWTETGKSDLSSTKDF